MQEYWPRGHRARGLWLGLVLSAAANAAPSTSPSPAGARACLSFQREEADKALLYHASNACQRSLDCRMTYRLSCQDADGKDVSSSEQRYVSDIAAQSTKAATLSAAACPHGWRISEVDWDCI